MRLLCGALGNPQDRLPPVIHVAGTNGKGSATAFCRALLEAQGLSVHVHTSPHLVRWHERYRIGVKGGRGQIVDDALFADALRRVADANAGQPITVFEILTAVTFILFSEQPADVVVLEVGLGGRLDAVNLVDADLALVTSIGLDHGDWLGDSRESVAFEKAGILRAGKPALCGDLEPPVPLLQRVAVLDCPFFLRGRDYDLAVDASAWHWRGLNGQGEVLELHDLPLLDLPLENAALAVQAYALLALPWQPEQIAAALLATHVVGRLDRRVLQWQGKTLTLLLDVGHNPHAADYLAQRLASRPPTGQRLAVFGLLADKDLPGVLRPLLAEVQGWAVTTLPTGRARPALELQAALLGLGAKVHSYPNVVAALEAQCEQAAEGDEILVFGSFYCVAEALDWLALRAQEEASNGFAG